MAAAPESNSSNTNSHFTGPISDTKFVIQGNSTNTLNYFFGGEQSESTKWDKCKNALRQTDPSIDRKTLIKSYGLDSEGVWESILENPILQDFKNQDDPQTSLIWVGSGASTGKTRLAVFITTHLERCKLDPKDCVIYFFCKNQEGRNTAASILKGLMFLLCEKDNALAKYLYEEYCSRGYLLLQDHQVEALWQIFEKMVDNIDARRVYCIIDGIDQCEESMLQLFLHRLNTVFGRLDKQQSSKTTENQRPSFSRASTDPMFQSSSVRKLRMMILTRERDTISDELRPFPRVPLNISTEMENLIDTKLRRVSTICSKNKDPSEDMIDTINRILNSGPDQSFLFVGLVSERIEGMTLNQLRKYEKSAPKTVEEFHCQTLGKVPPKQRPAVLAMLKWVALAERPLTALQLTKAVKYSLSRSFSRKSLQKAMKMCHGLITEVTEGGKDVIILGQRVTGLLFGRQSPLLEIRQLKEFVVEIDNVHSELANACVAYLQESANLEKSRRVRLRKDDELKKADRVFFEKHPFLEYAMVNWTYHAKRGNLEKTKYDVPFFEDKLTRRRLWWESYWISLRQTFAWKWTAPGNFSLLHLAAFFDIVPLARHVYEQGQLEQLLGAEDHQGMKPINWATENSATAMVQFLLEKGDFDKETLLQAARTGEISIIRMLLENERRRVQSPQTASPLSSPGSPSSPLQSFRKVTLRSLSDFSKTVDRTDKPKPAPMSPIDSGYGKAKSETPLHIAAACGHDEAVAAFLDAGYDFQKTTDGGWTALHNAAWFGRAPIVDRLICFGANPKAKTKDGLTPLHCAVKNSQAQIVKMLLDKKITEVEAEDQFGITPFHMACKCRNLPIMELMCQNGVDIERRMRIGWTPLMWAAVVGALDVAQWLIGHNAQVNAVWRHSHEEDGDSIELSPLDLAKSYRRPGIVQLLESHGGIDNRSLTSRSSLELPLPGVFEETYDLPEVQDIAMPPLERTETGDSLLSGDEDSSSEDEADSHTVSDTSDEESRSRKPSASSVDEDPEQRRQSSFALHGLGISEENENDMKPHESANLEAESHAELNAMQAGNEDAGCPAVQHTGQPPSSFDIDPTNDTDRQDSICLVMEPQTYVDARVKDINLDGVIDPDTTSSSADRAPVQAQSFTESCEQRKGSGSKSPIALGDFFARRTWKLGNAGSTKGGSVKDGAQSQSTSNEAQRYTSQDDRTLEATPEVNDGCTPSKADKGVFGKLKSKRGLSWKRDPSDTKAGDASTSSNDMTAASNS